MTVDNLPRIHSACRMHGRTNIYTFWTADSDLMVRVEVDTLRGLSTDGSPVKAVDTRRDDIPGDPWRPVTEDMGSRSARSVAERLIGQDREARK